MEVDQEELALHLLNLSDYPRKVKQEMEIALEILNTCFIRKQSVEGCVKR